MSSESVESKIGLGSDILVKLLGSMTLLVYLVFVSVNIANSASDDCITWDWESSPNYKFLNYEARSKVDKLRQALCRKMEAGEYDQKFVNNLFDAALQYKASCNRGDVNHEYWKGANNIPEAARRFCDRANKDLGNLINHVYQYRADLFCHFSRDITDPDGWAGFFMTFAPKLPSSEKLSAEAQSLCSKVRNGEITPTVAWQLFEQELKIAQARMPAEILQYGAEKTKSGIATIFKSLAVILGIIATIITIIVGLKKLFG